MYDFLVHRKREKKIEIEKKMAEKRGSETEAKLTKQQKRS